MSDDDFFAAPLPQKDIELSENLTQRGQEIDLTAIDPALKRLTIGVGWDFKSYDSDAVDVDVSLFLLNKDGVTREDSDFIFYNNPETLDGAIRHHGDSRDGAGDGDDETISIDLHAIPFDVVRALFVLSVYRADEKDQNLSMVKNTFLRIVNAENNFEMCRYVLDKELAETNESAMLVAALDREGPKWIFRPLGEFVKGGLARIAEDRGMVIVNS